jgi:hypothetical protein
MSVPFDVKSRIASTPFWGTTCDNRVASAFVVGQLSPRLPVSTMSQSIGVSFLTASMRSLERPTKIKRVIPKKCANLTQQVPMLPVGAVIMTVDAGCSSATFNARTALAKECTFAPTSKLTLSGRTSINQLGARR